jgi:EAL domain-containing protein (putative c-di-GMP-specific phosphodiesterase class I)
MKSIAQFVAQEATFESLRNIGVDFAGGFLFGQPQVSPSGLESTSGANPPDSWQI